MSDLYRSSYRSEETCDDCGSSWLSRSVASDSPYPWSESLPAGGLSLWATASLPKNATFTPSIPPTLVSFSSRQVSDSGAS